MDENVQTTPPPMGLVPSITNVWERSKGPIAFLAIGFLAGYFYKSRSKILKV